MKRGWATEIVNAYKNTIASGIYYEVKRIVPNTIPHYISDEKINKSLTPDGFKNIECVNYIEELFGKKIFIIGEADLGEYIGDANYLNVYVYNAKTGEIKSFRDIFVGGIYYSEVFHQLLFGIMYEEGLLDYLRTCK